MPRPFSRILHPTDFSPASAAALASALALAKAGRAKLVLLHVLTPPSPFVGDDVVAARTYEELEAGARRGARRELARRVARARRAGVPAAGVIVDGVASNAETPAAPVGWRRDGCPRHLWTFTRD
jgi:nucleotide-binding universal stress UspA family protein